MAMSDDASRMAEEPTPARHAPPPGFEPRDADLLLVLASLVCLLVFGATLQFVLWLFYRSELPRPESAEVSQPVRGPGEMAVNDRLAAIPAPRLEPLVQLRARPPSYRSSEPVPETASPALHAEDLRAARQPRLQSYGWVDRSKRIAHIPIDEAMDALIASGRLKTAPTGKKGQPDRKEDR